MPRKTKETDIQVNPKTKKSTKSTAIKSEKASVLKVDTKKSKVAVSKSNSKTVTTTNNAKTSEKSVAKDVASVKAKTANKKVATKGVVSTKKSTDTAKKSTKKTTDTSKASTKEATIANKSTTKNVSAKSKTSSKKNAKPSTAKKVQKVSSNKVSKVSTSKTSKSNKEPKLTFSPEYYDLPFKYNKTVVKLLAQTPTNLFIYWEISDEDRDNLKKHFGPYFFEITKPVLIIHNKTMNYSFEVDVDDFANSWYLSVNDSNSEYVVELGRRPIPINYNYMPAYNVEKDGPIEPINTPYIYISSSNELEAPNDRVLFNNTDKIYFRNVKTNEVIVKSIKDFKRIYKNGKFINIFEVYKELYKDLYQDEFMYDNFDLRNPSSGNPSSGSLSSRFI